LPIVEVGQKVYKRSEMQNCAEFWVVVLKLVQASTEVIILCIKKYENKGF